MSSTTLETTTSVVPTPSSSPDAPITPPVHHTNAVVAFIIGLSIILLASILNAAGLNLTKLDHVRTSAIPKASRRKDWLRPLWLLGMILYILSQLIGSTLALEYIRAEYVAPLGSTSLIFNFLFASFLVGTPVTNTDIYGTIIVIVGVVGIVLFGSINAGLEEDMSLNRLKLLWGRLNWLLYFFAMSFALILLYMFASQLEQILNARADITADPFSNSPRTRTDGIRLGWRQRFVSSYQGLTRWTRDKLEQWTAAKGDKDLAWTLGILWACCGGGLAGGCLVFAKACVKLISGSLSHQNTGNQFFHVAAIMTFILLATTAVMQIICLNRGLKVYDSTLVVPVFYGVYTASGFLNSLVFNNEIDLYKTWTLFLIFLSIVILISGVVLLTHKKPETRPKSTAPLVSVPAQRKAKSKKVANKENGKVDDASLEAGGEADGLHSEPEDDNPVVWELGEASDDEDGGAHANRNSTDTNAPSKRPAAASSKSDVSRVGLAGQGRGEEGRGLMQHDDHDMDDW